MRPSPSATPTQTDRRPAYHVGRAAWAGGVAGVLGMAALYAGVLLGTSGPEHLADQWASYWAVLVSLWVLFGLQVALLIDMRRASSRGLRAADAAAAGTTAVGMLACCAHHVAELLPLVASVGIAAALVAWQPWILAGALLLSIVGTVATFRRWHLVRGQATAPPLDAVRTLEGQPCQL